MQEYLRSTELIDWVDPQIVALAARLAVRDRPYETASRCFHWVRDEISHSFDIDTQLVSCTASDTLRNRTGICYAKSHLLAALLRANGIPAAFGYQRISIDESGTTFCLHGFNYVFLAEHGWHPVDPRGNRAGIETRFDPPNVSLAFDTQSPGERTDTTIFVEPLDCVAQCLRSQRTVSALRTSLPDAEA